MRPDVERRRRGNCRAVRDPFDVTLVAGEAAPSITPMKASTGARGVDGCLVTTTRPSSSIATRSVKVPPVSMPTLYITQSPQPCRDPFGKGHPWASGINLGAIDARLSSSRRVISSMSSPVTVRGGAKVTNPRCIAATIPGVRGPARGACWDGDGPRSPANSVDHSRFDPLQKPDPAHLADNREALRQLVQAPAHRCPCRRTSPRISRTRSSFRTARPAAQAIGSPP